MKKKIKKKNIVAVIIMLVAFAILVAIHWANKSFSSIDLSAILFYIQEPLQGTNMGAFTGIVKNICIWSPILTAIFLIPAVVTNHKNILEIRIWKKKFEISLDWYQKHIFKISVVMLLVSIIVVCNSLNVYTYIYNQFHASTIYEENYVDPQEVTLTFPEEKRNLIYIFMESMEDTYMSEEDGGAEYDNFIPEMTELERSNVNFTSSGATNGGISAYGATWTMGAMVAQTSGIPLSLPVGGNEMENGYDSFLPGAYSIGQILENEGYQQEFLLGSNALFGGRDTYMTQHGNYTIKDYNYAVDNGWIDEDYYVWWGYEDQKLYEFAKDELTSLAADDEPFNLTMLTVDTHFFSGYYCDICEDTFGDDQYANVIACASRQLSAFIEWVQEQDFYENTTIVICGDHPTMDEAYLNASVTVALDEYQRKVYTTIINPANDYELDYDREFTTMDMYPTTLASLGVEIEGDRLALGTNLFSDTPTLVEQLGLDTLNEQIEMTSKYYNKNILYATE